MCRGAGGNLKARVLHARPECLHFGECLGLHACSGWLQARDVREALRAARDVPRVPEGAPPAPDLISAVAQGRANLQGLQELGVEGVASGVVKAGTKALLWLSKAL